MAPHFSTLAWKIPWMQEPGGLQSMGLLRVRHDWATSLSLFTFMHWRRKWQPTPVFLPGEFQGQGEPGGLPSLGLHRVGHDWSDLATAATLPSSFFTWECGRSKGFRKMTSAQSRPTLKSSWLLCLHWPQGLLWEPRYPTPMLPTPGRVSFSSRAHSSQLPAALLCFCCTVVVYFTG